MPTFIHQICGWFCFVLFCSVVENEVGKVRMEQRRFDVSGYGIVYQKLFEYGKSIHIVKGESERRVIIKPNFDAII